MAVRTPRVHSTTFSIKVFFFCMALFSSRTVDSQDKGEIVFNSGQAGIPPSEYMKGMSPRVNCIPDAMPSIAIQMEFTLSSQLARHRGLTIRHPPLHAGDKVPLADRVLTLKAIGGENDGEGQVIFHEQKSRLDGADFWNRVAVCECGGGNFNGLFSNESGGVLVLSISQPKNNPRSIADVIVTQGMARVSQQVSEGDIIAFGDHEFKLESIHVAKAENTRYGWIVLNRTKQIGPPPPP